MECRWVWLCSAETQKRGFCDRKFGGEQCRLVKLQRPPPEMRIFSAGLADFSSSRTERPRRPASIAAIRPAAPATRMTTSKLRKNRTQGKCDNWRLSGSFAGEGNDGMPTLTPPDRAPR